MDFDPAQAVAAQQAAAKRQQALSGALRSVSFFTGPADQGGMAPAQAIPSVTTPGTAAVPNAPAVTQPKTGTWANGKKQPDYTGYDAVGGPAYG